MACQREADEAGRAGERAERHDPMAAVTIDQAADRRRHQAGHQQAAEKPPIAKVNEKPRSAAISGSIRTGV